MPINITTNPELSAKYYSQDKEFFAQKSEKTTDKYRREFIKLVVDQEGLIDEDLEALAFNIDKLVRKDQPSDLLSSISPLFKTFFLTTFAGLLLRNNIKTALLNGKSQIEQIDDEYNGQFNSDMRASVNKTVDLIGNTIMFRKDPFTGIEVGKKIVTLSGGSLNATRNIITVGIEEGWSAKQLSSAIQNYLIKPDLSLWTSPYEYFRKAFGYERKQPSAIPAGSIEFNCKRIARTEINNTWRQATLLANKDQEWVEGYDWNLSSSHPVKDICLKNCDILTSEGWIPIENVSKKMQVAQFTEDHRIEFVLPSRVIHKKYAGKIYKLSLPYGNSIEMTEGHRQPLWSKKQKKFIVKPIEKVLLNNLALVYSGSGTGSNKKLTPMEKLMIAFQADGHSVGNNGRVTWHFHKERKKERLRKLCNDAKISLKEYKNGYFSCYLNKKSKILKDVFNVNMGADRAKSFIKEVSLWDGSIISNNHYMYCSKIQENLDFVSAIAVQAGYRVNFSGKLWKRLSMTKKQLAKANACKITSKLQNTNVHCVTVPSSMIVVRSRGGMALVTGNCDDWQAGNPHTYDEIKTFGHSFCLCNITTRFKKF